MLHVLQILHEISVLFPFFKGHYKGWKDSVRHNLSLNDCFIKVSLLLTTGDGCNHTVTQRLWATWRGVIICAPCVQDRLGRAWICVCCTLIVNTRKMLQCNFQFCIHGTVIMKESFDFVPYLFLWSIWLTSVISECYTRTWHRGREGLAVKFPTGSRKVKRSGGGIGVDLFQQFL